ncbi:glycosyl hydrolase family 65 protein [Mycoplasma anserisalpingitidis]|uniref:Glycoside hydrolase family 65 protein n=1 Tax=Mycoplasma anserisalpingitidis TaxID=519450 RepID=A0A5B8KAR9_9MOLU|nr:glycosyl hydrolase family 65 protein [Mycoplasma anserisalpingitidis]QDY88127.1 glycoside hydrolase family 65 protein [Mycoplasma anserisalpingitidis]
MNYLKYDTKNKVISQEIFNPNVTAKTESIFSLGNGYLGIRSADEEKSVFNKEDFFVNGIFNKDSEDEVSELANLADLMTNTISLNGVVFQIENNDIYKKTLDIKKGILTREIIAKRSYGTFKLNFERFVSQSDLNVYGQKITIEVLELNNKENVDIRLYPSIDATVTNSGTQHFSEGSKLRPTQTSLRMQQKTTFSKRLVVHNLVTKFLINGELIQGGTDDYVIEIKRRLIRFNIKANVKNGDKLELFKLMSVHTSIDDANEILSDETVVKNADLKLEFLQQSDYETLKKESIEKMNEKVWNQFDVEIVGDEKSEYEKLALDFGIFHLNSFVPKHSTFLNVGAKGLSGEGYQGHTYWDTEFFINPNYLFTEPKIVRNLLTYRYRGIESARSKAKEVKLREQESNLEGAQYPWEMAWPTDGEVCPYWGQADVVSGKQVPIASRRQEIHVSADVAFAIHQYYNITQDQQFMDTMGYEMIIDTAIFYSNRAEKQNDGTYSINDVMGPNEYKGNIDNNAYINRLAKYNIDLALNYIEKLSKSNPQLLKEIESKIPYAINVDKLKEVSQKLKQQNPNKDLIIAENDQFLALPRIDVTPFQLLGDAGKKLFSTKEGHKRLCSQLVKQADVVLLTYLMPELYDYQTRKANFEYYEPITTHDSSLSAATYAIEAIRLRKMSKAYQLFRYALDIDMGQNMHSSDAGIHAGSLAAIWQMIVFGYGGLSYYDDKITLDPILPENWSKLRYKFSYLNTLIEVNVNKDHFTVRTVKQGQSVKLWVRNSLVELTNDELKFEVRHA